MSSFNSAPREVVAHRWLNNGDHPDDGPPDREGQVVRRFRRPDIGGGHLCSHCDRTMNVHGWIDADANGRTVCPGDWIITTAAGDRYPCKPDLFEAMYPEAQGLGPALHTPYTFSHAVDDARATLLKAEAALTPESTRALCGVAEGYARLASTLTAAPTPHKPVLHFGGEIDTKTFPVPSDYRRREELTMKTIICSLNRADGESAAAFRGLALPRLLWADASGRGLTAVSDAYVLVTDSFHQHPQAELIWAQVRACLHHADLPEAPPAVESVFWAAAQPSEGEAG